MQYAVGRNILSVDKLNDGQDCPSYKPIHNASNSLIFVYFRVVFRRILAVQHALLAEFNLDG